MSPSASMLRADREAFLDYCRPAHPIDYYDWLAGYLRQGDTTPKRVQWDMPQRDWFVLVGRPRGVPQLYGALSVQVIVPSDVDLRLADLPHEHGAPDVGHSTFLFYPQERKGRFEVVGHLPPLYADVIDMFTRDERRKLGL